MGSELVTELNQLPVDAPVLAVALGPMFEQDGRCYAAGQAGLFRSSDAGGSWRQLIDDIANVSVFSLALSPDGCLFAGIYGGIVRSQDGGATRAISVLPPPPPTVSALCVSPNFRADGAVFAGTAGDGIFSSIDRGVTWNAWNFGLLDHDVICLAISPNYASDETLFAGTGSGVFTSTNRGRAWYELELPVVDCAVLSLALSPRFGQDGLVYAGLEDNGLWLSSDAGLSWSRAGEDVLQGTINAIDVAADGHVLIAAKDGVYRSADRGHSWELWAPAAGVLGIAIPQASAAGDGAAVLAALAEGGVRRLVQGSRAAGV